MFTVRRQNRNRITLLVRLLRRLLALGQGRKVFQPATIQRSPMADRQPGSATIRPLDSTRMRSLLPRSAISRMWVETGPRRPRLSQYHLGNSAAL